MKGNENGMEKKILEGMLRGNPESKQQYRKAKEDEEISVKARLQQIDFKRQT